MAVHKESEIKITVGLDENKIPETITWDATDGGVTNEQAKALMMGVWDDKNAECLRIDLWTKDMLMDDMKHGGHCASLRYARFRPLLRGEDRTYCSRKINLIVSGGH